MPLFWPNEQLSPSGTEGWGRASFYTLGTRSQKTIAFLSLGAHGHKDRLPCWEDHFSISFGWEEKHSICCIVLGDSIKYSHCPGIKCRILRTTLLPFRLLKAISCINNPGSCENQISIWTVLALAFYYVRTGKYSLPSQQMSHWLGVLAKSEKFRLQCVNHSAFYFTNCLSVLAAHISS